MLKSIYFSIKSVFGKRELFGQYENVSRFQGGDNLSTEHIKTRTMHIGASPLEMTPILWLRNNAYSVGHNTATRGSQNDMSC